MELPDSFKICLDTKIDTDGKLVQDLPKNNNCAEISFVGSDAETQRQRTILTVLTIPLGSAELLIGTKRQDIYSTL